MADRFDTSAAQIVAAARERAAQRERDLHQYPGNATARDVAQAMCRTRVYELRKRDAGFAAGWEEAEERAADALEAEAWRRAVVGVQEPLVSGGKVVRDDDGQPLAIRRYSDTLMLALLKARRPPRRERSVRFRLLALQSAADAVGAMAAIAAGVAAGK